MERMSKNSPNNVQDKEGSYAPPDPDHSPGGETFSTLMSVMKGGTVWGNTADKH